MWEELLCVSHKKKDKMYPTYLTVLKKTQTNKTKSKQIGTFNWGCFKWPVPRGASSVEAEFPSLANTNFRCTELNALLIWSQWLNKPRFVQRRPPRNARSYRQRITAKYHRNCIKCILLTRFSPYWPDSAEGVMGGPGEASICIWGK